MTHTTLLASLALVVGCATNEVAEIGDATVGTNTLHIVREGPAAAAGAMTTLVLKATAGEMPTSIVGWVGIESATGSTKATGEYDAADGDYDLAITCPSPMITDSKFWFTVETSGQFETGSISLK